MKAPTLYLASRSPRRKELLSQAGLGFRVYVPRKEELLAPTKAKRSEPGRIVRKIAEAKARSAWEELSAQGAKRGVILSADTLVFQSGKVLGKPSSKAEAKRMLRKLSGRWHLVSTAVSCWRFEGRSVKKKTIHVNTRVKFFPLTDAWLDWYIATGEPMDKAGSYGAQAFGSAMIEKFSGSYTNVVGLPVGETLKLLEEVTGLKRTELMQKR